MGKYVPTTITYEKSGLVKDRDAFVLSDDAYQRLENMWTWRGRLRRRQGYQLLGRLRRDLTAQAQSAADGTVLYNIADILTSFRASEPDAELVPSTVAITVAGTDTFTDDGSAAFSRTAGSTYDLYPAQSISSISQAASAVIDFGAAHEFIVGSKVYVTGVSGMTEINDTVGTVTAIGATSITVNINSSSFSSYSSGGTADGSFVNYDTGEVNLQWLAASTPPNTTAIAAAFSYYPCLPVMGLPQRELSSINAEQTVAFDTIYAYRFNNTTNRFRELEAATATTWQGSDSDFFWSVNYWQTADFEPYFWTTNFNTSGSPDPIRVYDGTDWHTFAPTTSGSNELHQCRMLIPYKGRLVALNTWEGGTLATSEQYPQRARWSQNGAPFSSVNAGTAPTATDEWRSDVKGRGGFVDAPTNEHIVSAEFVRDLLVVGFEHSTWALRYTGNEILPFVWERINRELGSESTFSMVAFDRGVLGVGDKSINSCNGNSVERIDDSIPDEVFNIHNSFNPASELSDGPRRVHGIRDFFERVVYWTFPDASTQAKFPDKLLVFNYQNYTWALFNDSFTTLGEYQRFNDVTWADLAGTTWQNANFSWVTAQLQSQFPNTIAGNQRGFVEILHQRVYNDVSLNITDVTGGASPVVIEATDHNLQDNEYVIVNGIQGTGADELNGRIFQVVRDESGTPADELLLFTKPRVSITGVTQATQAVVTCPGHSFSVGEHWYIDRITAGMTELTGKNGLIVAVSGNTVTLDIDSSGFSAYTTGGEIQNLDANVVPVFVQSRTYMGKGTLTRVSNFEARSKKFNMVDKGQKNFLGYIDFLANTTAAGEIACEVYTDYSDTVPINSGDDSFFNTVFSTQPEQFSQLDKSKDWHRFYCTTDSQFFEYRLKLNERQMFTPQIVNSDALISAIVIWSEGGGRLVD